MSRRNQCLCITSPILCHWNVHRECIPQYTWCAYSSHTFIFIATHTHTHTQWRLSFQSWISAAKCQWEAGTGEGGRWHCHDIPSAKMSTIDAKPYHYYHICRFNWGALLWSYRRCWNLDNGFWLRRGAIHLCFNPLHCCLTTLACRMGRTCTPMAGML